MQILTLCDNYINSLKKYQKLELYFIITILIFSLFYFFAPLNKKIVTNENNTLNVDIINTIFIITKIEKWAKKHKIKINKIDFTSSLIKFEISSSLFKVINFIHYSQSLTKKDEIEYVDIIYNKKIKKYNLKLYINFDYIKNNEKTFSFIKIKNVFKTYKMKKEFSLNAIYGNFVIINNKVYKLNDKLRLFTLSKITNNEVYLTYKEDIKILKVRHNDKY